MRAQTELPAIGIAFLLLTVVVILVVGTANTALTSADRPAIEQQEAAGLSDQLVSQRASIISLPVTCSGDTSWLSTYFQSRPSAPI